jgi:hypothetical protein
MIDTMFNSANQAAIFVPMLVVVALTFVAFVHLAIARGKAAGQMPPEYYRAHIGDPEPEAARAAVRHYGNLLELPTLFYAACLTAFVLSAVDMWTLIFAWSYTALRLMQSAVHMSYNNPMHRGLAFMAGALALLALWVNVAAKLFAAL